MRLLIRYLGFLFIISGIFRLVPIITGLIYGEKILSFIIMLGISVAIGLIMVLTNRNLEEREAEFSLTHGLLLTAISFVVLPAVGAFSYMPTMNFSYIDSYFESISGFTTTGLSLYESLNPLPKSLIMWRALTQWMGGIGIITVFLFIFTKLHAHDYSKTDADQDTSAMKMYQAAGFEEKFEGGLSKTFHNIILIYSTYTLLGIALLLIVGVPIFDSIGLTFTALSTGGFSVSDYFPESGLQLTVLSLLMILGSISFIVHNRLLRREFKNFIRAFEKNVMLFFIALACLLSLLVVGNVKLVVFNIISAFTTTGFAFGEIATLKPFLIFSIVIGMLVGGTIASTSGGIKVFRIYYLIRAIPWSIKKLSLPPHAIIPLDIHGTKVTEAKLSNIGIFLFTYALVIVLGIGIFMIFGHSFFVASFHMVSALGTVGIQATDLTVLGPTLKIVLIIAMLFGRLEIFPLLILMRTVISKSRV